LINNEYPFFLDSIKMPTYGFLLIIQVIKLYTNVEY